jgi:DNA-binding GntR family transcriptional regulator
VAEMDTEADLGRLGELNRRFHMSLYFRAGHAKFLALTEQQLAVADRYLRFHLSAKGREHLAQEDHRGLLAAAEARDVEAAVSIVKRHLATAAATIAEFFRQRSP